MQHRLGQLYKRCKGNFLPWKRGGLAKLSAAGGGSALLRHSRNARTPHHAGYRVDHVVDRMELLWVRQQHKRHRQRAGLAIGTQSCILDAFKVDDMGETKDAADHLARAEAEHVGKQRIQKGVSRRLKRGDVLWTGKHDGWEYITRRVLVPQREEGSAERLPEDLRLSENPFLISHAVVVWRRVPGLGVPIQQEIAEKCAQVESDGAVEGEFRIDYAAVVFRNHHRAGMKIAVNERLGLTEKFLPKSSGGNFERPIAAKVRDDLVELRGGVTVTRASDVGLRKNKVYADAH